MSLAELSAYIFRGGMVFSYGYALLCDVHSLSPGEGEENTLALKMQYTKLRELNIPSGR